MVFLQACLNGDRDAGVPRTAEELAAEARACIGAGAVSIHVHPRDADGHETLDPAATAAVVRALRPLRVEISLTTGLWITGGDVDARAAAIAGWTERPDLVSLNFSEEGSRELADVLDRPGLAASVRGENGRVVIRLPTGVELGDHDVQELSHEQQRGG